MNRPKNRAGRAPGVPLVIGGVTPGSTRRPSDSSRTDSSRLGRAMSRAGKNSAPRTTDKPSTAKALERWENEGGRAKNPVATKPESPKRPVKKTKAASRVNRSKIKQAGLESRLLGHVSASGKRSQARRDSKNG